MWCPDKICQLFIAALASVRRMILTIALFDNHHHSQALFKLCYIPIIFSSPEPSGSQGELIVYPWSGVRRCPSSSVHIFKRLIVWNRLNNRSQILCGASLGRGNKSLYKWSRSHDQDGRHNAQNLKKLSSPEPVGQLPWNLACSIRVCSTTKFI